MGFFYVDTSRLEVGKHVFPFNFSLPHQLPSTFIGEYGHVWYAAKVKVYLPGGRERKKERFFEVISSSNLNDVPSLAVSVICELKITFNFKFCNSNCYSYKIIVGCYMSRCPTYLFFTS